MAFLFQDQNQGTRQDDSPREDAREIATVLFHPDFNRRLRLRTESADPLFPKLSRTKALAGLGVVKALTAGGEFRPALRTSSRPT
jgi:hypothetical protein